jgi:hypothetical protein
MRAALYVRTSTLDQTTENQERELWAVAGRLGHEVIEIYADNGISGAKGRDKRPAFDRLCRDATRRRFDIIMAWSVDRLGRSLQDLVPADATRTSPGRPKLSPRSVTNRSRISNGKEILPGIDQRLAIARRYRDLVAQIVIDQGGVDRCSETRMQLIRRFASGAVLAEELEARLARGENVDISEYALLSSTLVRLANRIGIERVARDISPTLSDILRRSSP